jgi:hypothetical protein
LFRASREMSGRGGRAHLDKDERKIVGRHRHDLAQLKPLGRRLADEVVYVAHAPSRLPPLEICVERGV